MGLRCVLGSVNIGPSVLPSVRSYIRLRISNILWLWKSKLSRGWLPSSISLHFLCPSQAYPWYRSLARRDAAATDCGTVCGSPPPADHTGQTCATDRWVPVYETKGDCECLAAYKCCSGTCSAINLESCWANDKKGMFSWRRKKNGKILVKMTQ